MLSPTSLLGLERLETNDPQSAIEQTSKHDENSSLAGRERSAEQKHPEKMYESYRKPRGLWGLGTEEK
jgi:hypothetical protein